MPEAVERCVTSLLRQWKNDPSKRPPPKKEGQDAKSQAFAMCNAAANRQTAEALVVMFEDGFGPTFMGAAATNRPYIPKLKPTRVEGEEGEEYLLVHLANSGKFMHPLSGPFVLNRQVYLSFINNFQANVIGQDAMYDCRHQPDQGAFGWFKELLLGDEIGEGEKEFWGRVKPTPVGLEAIKSGRYKYSSMEWFPNYSRSDVTLDLSHEGITQEFCLVETDGTTDDLEGSMTDTVTTEDLRKAQTELSALQEKQIQLEQTVKEAQEAREQAEREATKTQEALIALEQAGIDREASRVITLAASHRDEEGNGLPRQFTEWVAKFLKFERIGEDGDAITLSDDAEVGAAIRQYVTASVERLILSMPGYVPVGRQTSGGQDSTQPGDKFDWDSEWEEK